MASELKELVFKMNRLDCYKRYAMHKMLRDSGVYFGQPPVLDYLSEHGECSQKSFRRHKCFAGIGGGIRKTNAKERAYHKNIRRKRPALQPDSSYRKWQAAYGIYTQSV